MEQSVQKEDMLSVPSGGIADFYMSDEDIAVIEQEEAQKAFGSEGVAAFDTVAKKMASYGRFGDDRIVHVESGEIVVPRALIEQSPELKESIFSHLREQGVEDPERYVVGSSANSLNPETGLPEFFLSKLVKKVGKVLKKAAPVILPVALSMTGLGPVYGAALGSGIGTLMQGGDIEDALKNAVIAGGTGAVFSGASSVAGGGTFMEGVSGAFADPGARFQQFGTGLTTDAPLFQQYTPATQTPSEAYDFVGDSSFQDTADLQQTTEPSFFKRTADFIMPENVTTTDALKQMGVDPAAATETQFKLAQEMAAEQSPGFLRRYGPSLALAGVAAGSAGFFDAPEEDEPEFLTGADLIEQDPDKYKLPDEEIQYVAPYDPFVPQRPVFTAADGGVAEVFPRRTGGIMPDEGIAGEDSVRAMLMPGEFVMTTDAVKGLGNGNNDQGIRKMYDMMRGLEAKGRAMA